jgi:hypothetical protein
MAITFTYKGSEAVEMLKTHFPKTWEAEIEDGVLFLKSIMRMYKLDGLKAYEKYLKTCGSIEKGISTLAALHTMNEQVRIGREIKELQQKQLTYGIQSTALEASNATSHEDKKILRGYYSTKQTELQQTIDELLFSYPIIGAKKVIVQTSIFGN